MRTTFIAFSLILLAGCQPNTSSTTPSIPGAQYFTEDGAWCWFQDPRAVYIEGQYKRTYAGWMTHDGQLQVGAYNHQNGSTEFVTLKENWDVDDHNTNSFLVLPDNRLATFYARHNKEGLFVRTTANPEDIQSWNEEAIVSDAQRITYNHPVHLEDEGRFFVFWRGPSWKPTLAMSTDLTSWSESQILLQAEGREADDIRPYLKVVSDDRSTIHFAFTDGHPRNELTNSIYYLVYRDGAFYSAAGIEVGTLDSLPISITPDLLVYDAGQTDVRAWVWDIALDSEGRPIIAYTRLPDEIDHRYHYARWTGETWTDAEITPGGPWFPQTQPGAEEREVHYSGGIAIHQANPSIVYISRQVNGQFEIEKYETSDEGLTWAGTPITENSEHLNVRPVVPRGYHGEADHLLWMAGEYVHYTDYRTGIRMKIGT